jgi:adenosylmethionine-8-amino-7-oxononanoate aminotransferase
VMVAPPFTLSDPEMDQLAATLRQALDAVA